MDSDLLSLFLSFINWKNGPESDSSDMVSLCCYHCSCDVDSAALLQTSAQLQFCLCTFVFVVALYISIIFQQTSLAEIPLKRAVHALIRNILPSCCGQTV